MDAYSHVWSRHNMQGKDPLGEEWHAGGGGSPALSN